MNRINNILHEMRAAFFLLIGFAMLAVICAATALGTLMRPIGWAERRSAQL